jgi:hypothetical protein
MLKLLKPDVIIVVMGRIKRDWGFRIGPFWMAAKEYKGKYSHGMRCT